MRARGLAIYILNTEMNLRQAQIADALGVTRQAVSKCCREIEDRRHDGGALDELLLRIAGLMKDERENAA